MTISATPIDFFCEHTPTKNRVFVLLAHPEGPRTLRAVLACTDPVLAYRAARALRDACSGESPGGSADDIAVLLPDAPAASFRHALEHVRAAAWPISNLGPVPWAELTAAMRHEQQAPDFTHLFPVKECDCGDEEHCDICGGSQLTPRTADLLHTALSMLGDTAYDDALEHGGDPVTSDEGFDWFVFDRLPRITWRQGASWRRQFARACDDLASDLARGDWPEPRNNAEEMALHLAIEDAESLQEEQEDEDMADAEHQALPRHRDDYDWAMCSEDFFQDHDILMLFDEEMSGIEDPATAVNQYGGVGDLRPGAWFEYFGNVKRRDPDRGFRR